MGNRVAVLFLFGSREIARLLAEKTGTFSDPFPLVTSVCTRFCGVGHFQTLTRDLVEHDVECARGLPQLFGIRRVEGREG